ncbi:PQQ-dependent sugar dehydrogenase [Pontibacter lucknowensis]|uniref:Glucose/arabinose dehydrogenase, beta-propeller fold n=1 Tax=Pontibacter lucknowensis TaxID=1077936 RepID=A0A1N6XK50_9BACT|nr:PQQ-dependent sugar dehydrogenase [Pontibacter lucknowensis]SIR02599.1 Glucose/arabinose dehydrogenase, beta-propeller fold [Pontibacter lucknowensis]
MKLSRLLVLSALGMATMGASCSEDTTTQQNNDQQEPVATQEDCQPIDRGTANTPDQKPTFEGQTRACEIKSETQFDVQVLTKNLQKPWAVEPLPDGNLLVTEKSGNMRIVSASGQIGNPITGVPKVDARGQGGLLDVALGPDFGSDRMIYWSFSEPRKGGNATSVARARLSDDRSRLENVEVIFQAQPTYDGTMHYGSRLAFGPDGMLYITLGERSDKEIRPQAQQMNSHMGKIIRIAPDGKVPDDNPFVNQNNTLPEIWTAGHRNVQASAFNEAGEFWIVDHGPQGGDEVNKVEKGKNYGWPVVTFGEEYSGAPVPNAVTTKEGYVDPVYYWDPVIAPSGAQFYTGSAFPEWKGNLFVGGLREQALVRLRIENNRVTGEEHLLTDRKQRIRDVRQGPDGALYVVTDHENGELWKITPR